MLVEILLLIVGIPAGYLIAYLARDEIVVGRSWFLVLIALGVFAGVFGFYIGRAEIGWGGLFIIVVAGISYFKSFDKGFVKKRFK
jgi:hypothetical protein